MCSLVKAKSKEHMIHEITIGHRSFRIRPIRPEDNQVIRNIILETLIEHGAVGEGFASSDADTQHMYEAFQAEGRFYYVLEEEGQVMGGVGIASLPGEPGTCELVKMYFRPEVRGIGMGKKLLTLCLDQAKTMGYQQVYLETITQMKAARGLYEHLGFIQIDQPMGDTGHFSCNIFYLLKLGIT